MVYDVMGQFHERCDVVWKISVIPWEFNSEIVNILHCGGLGWKADWVMYSKIYFGGVNINSFSGMYWNVLEWLHYFCKLT